MSSNNTLLINEIFYSIQGESLTTGEPTIFIRLAGCPLRCSYCDTSYAFKDGEELSFDSIMTKINKYNIYSIQHYLSFLSQEGYTKHSIVKFKTKKNLITKNKFSMGSHSVKLDNKNEIKSGPLILDWYFILSQINNL